MIGDSYFLIDGSHLFASLEKIWKTKKTYEGKKVSIGLLNDSLKRTWELQVQSKSIRTNLYFRKGDPRIGQMLIFPKTEIPGEKDNWKKIECGEKSGQVPSREIAKVDLKYRDKIHRLEKGLDTRLTCDALIYVSKQMASKLILLVNDGDYIPLFEAVQQLGGNVYLTSLDSDQKIHKGLSQLCDKYLSLDSELDYIFGLTKQEKPEDEQEIQQI